MHSHIFIPSTKKDVCYCKICNKLSYKGIVSEEFPLKINPKFDIDPLKLKFRPASIVSNYNLENHKKYLESKIIGITKINYLVNNFGLKSMVYYKAINFMNQIFLENEISLDNIETIASLCVLFAAEFNDCCLPSVSEKFISKNENDILYHSHSNSNKKLLEYENNGYNKMIKEEKIKNKTNLLGLSQYIRKNIQNYKYWEILCLKNLNYDLGKYSAYDYLMLFFELGIFFCKQKINLLDLLKYCINILDFITKDKKSCEYSQYTLAMSIIKVALDNSVFFDKDIFKYIYGVDLSKKKYLNCSNMIKNLLNLSYNIDNLINVIYNNQFIINQQLFIHKYLDNLAIKAQLEKRKNKFNNNKVNNFLTPFGKFYLSQFQYIINNNNIIINNNFFNNNINITNTNLYFQNYIISNYFNYFNSKCNCNNNNFYIKK